MEQIISDLMVFFGADYTPVTFMDLITWFIIMAFGCAIFRYVLYSIFWLANQFNKGGRR